MHIEDLAEEYLKKTDEELLQLAMDSEQLTDAAQTTLTNEMAKRRINLAERSKVFREEGTHSGLERPLDNGVLPSRESHQVTEFVAEVLRVYHNHFWLFVKLIAPAVIIGYLAIITGRHEGREIARHIPRGVEALEHKTEMLEMFLVNQIGYLVSWIAFCFCFGAICSAVRQIGDGVIPSVRDSFAAVRARMGSFLRLSLLLYALLLALVATASVLSLGTLRILSRHQAHPTLFTIQIVFVALMGSAILVLSRFGLAMPALILGDCRVGQAMFRSDQLTEGKWLTLAAFLFKSLVGGYVAGMCPFWLASWISRGAPLPSWFPWLLNAVSVAAVIVVEPTMFIGFALLYSRMAALLSTPGETRTL